MYFNRFDIYCAYYCFFVNYNNGQSCKMYTRLTKMLKNFRPSPLLKAENLEENALQIYNNLVANF